MQITENHVVSFHYALINDQGEVLDGSRAGNAIPYLHGHQNIVPGLEEAMEGKSAGDTFKITLAPQQAYGSRDEEKVYDVDPQLFAGIEGVEPGFMCQMTNESGEQELVSVLEVGDDYVTVDANHPYAGQSLTFDVEIVDVRLATPQELEAGQII